MRIFQNSMFRFCSPALRIYNIGQWSVCLFFLAVSACLSFLAVPICQANSISTAGRNCKQFTAEPSTRDRFYQYLKIFFQKLILARLAQIGEKIFLRFYQSSSLCLNFALQLWARVSGEKILANWGKILFHKIIVFFWQWFLTYIGEKVSPKHLIKSIPVLVWK